MLQESILQYLRPSLACHLSFRPLFCLFLSGRLRQILLYAENILNMFFFREADIERKEFDNYTPLLLASVYGHPATVDLLIQKGADTAAIDKNDKTAIFLACEENQLSCLEVRIAN